MANNRSGSVKGKAGVGTPLTSGGAAAPSPNPTTTPSTANNALLSGPRFGVPPRIIGEPVRFWGRSVLEWFAIVVGIILGISYMALVPFPANLILKTALAVLIAVLVWGYVAFPTRANKTTLEWSIIYLASLYSNVPRHTKARDSFGASGTAATNRYASAASLSANYLREQQSQPQSQRDQGH